LARALIHQPRLLLLDEPLGALDALTRIEMQQLIEKLWRQHGFTVLLVTHDVAEAVAVADRGILIEQGRIGLDLTADRARPRPPGHARTVPSSSRSWNPGYWNGYWPIRPAPSARKKSTPCPRSCAGHSEHTPLEETA